MEIYTVSEARANLYKLIDQISLSHEAAYIKGKRHKVVVLGEEDYRSLQETLLLLSIPGMRESLLEGLETPIEDCVPDEKLTW